jgi:hypothetical protein
MDQDELRIARRESVAIDESDPAKLKALSSAALRTNCSPIDADARAGRAGPDVLPADRAGVETRRVSASYAFTTSFPPTPLTVRAADIREAADTSEGKQAALVQVDMLERIAAVLAL